LRHDLESTVQQHLSNAWVHSIHHYWLKEVVEFIERDSYSWRNYEFYSSRLRRLLQGCHLYDREEEAVRDVIAKLDDYAGALRQLAKVEADEFWRCCRA